MSSSSEARLQLLLLRAGRFEKLLIELNELIRDIRFTVAQESPEKGKAEIMLGVRMLSFPELAKALNRPQHECPPIIEALDLLDCNPDTYGD